MEVNEENMQKMYAEFQMLNNNIKQMEKQHEALESQLMDLTITSQSLEDLEKIKPGTEILVPINSGIYAKAEIKDIENFIVNVGSSITLTKDRISTKELIDKQIEEIKKLQESIYIELQSSTTKAVMLEKEMNQIASTVNTK